MKMITPRFYFMGYGTTNLILNSGTSFWILVFWLFLCVISIILTFIKSDSDKFEKFRSKLNKFVFF